MKKIGLCFLATTLMIALPLWAADDAQPQMQQPAAPGYGDGGMGSGMMGPGSGYQGRGPGMMYNDGRMGRGMRGGGHMMGPDSQGWQEMPAEDQERYRQMRSQYMQDTLPLRQELSSKQIELETLWDQPDPDPEKMKELSNRIAELRSQLDRKRDDYLMQCRQTFGDRGWACPGGGSGGY